MGVQGLFRALLNIKVKMTNHGKKIRFIDLSLRDGHQSLLATRMSTSQVLDVLPDILETNCFALEVWGGATLDSAMRFLDEDPFERLERIYEVSSKTNVLLRALSRGQNLFAYDHYPDDIVQDFNAEAVRTGIGIMRIFDALNDPDNLKQALIGTKRESGLFDAAMCYTTGDIFSVDYFINKALKYEEMGADMITDKDMAGLKDPAVSWRLYRQLKKKLKVPVVSHTHCTPGYGHISAVIALLAGVDYIDTAFLPFAGGPSHPSVEVIRIFADLLGIETEFNTDKSLIGRIQRKLEATRDEIARKWNLKPHISKWPGDDVIRRYAERIIELLGSGDIDEALAETHKMEDECGFPPPNISVREAQIPGGMYSNFVSQLAGDNKSDKLDDALREVQAVRKVSGMVPLVTPTSQIVGVQAYQNVILGEFRKDIVSTQFRKLIAGNYGRTPGEISPDLREEICGHREPCAYDSSAFDCEIPIVEELGRERNIPIAKTEREKLLYYLYPKVAPKILKPRRFEEHKDIIEAIEREKAEEKKQKELERKRLQEQRKKEEEERRKKNLIYRFLNAESDDERAEINSRLSEAVSNGSIP